MGRLATRADFEGLAHGPKRLRAGDGALDLEHRPWLYDDYRWTETFPQRAEWIKEHYPKVKTVLVAGCGWGFLVDALHDRGCDVYGFDASPYALEQAARHLSAAVAWRVMPGDAGDLSDLRLTRRKGLPGFDLVVTEDLLPCADDDAEARRWLENLRAVGKRVLHICTPKSAASPDNDLLWKTHREWAVFCRPDPVLCTECMHARQEKAR